MERLTALADFFATYDRADLQHFLRVVPLRSAEFWSLFWDSLWTRSEAMSYLSYTFWLFLLMVAAVYYLCPKPVKPVWLLACSYAFYLYDRHTVALVAVLIAATAVTWVCGLAIELLKKRALRLAFLWVAAAATIGTLGYYKYSVFFARMLGLEVKAGLPTVLGLSYFIFQSLGYVIDVYRGAVPAERNPIYYALYVSFFPCIVSGPIERAGHLLPQLRQPRGFSWGRFTGGLYRMLWGLFKKLVIAGNLDLFTRPVFTEMSAYGGGTLALAALAFSYQLYMDFSGYCDLALGAGQVLGYDLLENFDRPFWTPSFAELWRRWHISLTSWFRDYLYIPLGGSRCAPWRIALNTMIIFLVSGLWHGAGVAYVVWGLLNGLFMVIGRFTRKARAALAEHNPLYRIKPLRVLIQGCIGYLLFTFCIVFFAAAFYGGDVGDGWYLLTHLLASGGPALAESLPKFGLDTLTLYIMGGGILLVEAMEWWGRPQVVIRKLWYPARMVLYCGLLIAILLAANFGASGFVYGLY